MKILKYTVLALASLSLAALTYGQSSTIGFANNPLQPVTDGRTGAPAVGGSYTVGLYWSLAGTGEYALIDTAPIVTSGVFNNGGQVVTLPVAGSTEVQVVIKAWTGAFASYEDALSQGGANDWVGVSLPTNPYLTAAAGSPPPNLVIQGGFQGFTTVPVPEPSTVVLGLLGGLGALVLLRRRA